MPRAKRNKASEVKILRVTDHTMTHMTLEQIIDILPEAYRHQLLAFDPNQVQRLLTHR